MSRNSGGYTRLSQEGVVCRCPAHRVRLRRAADAGRGSASALRGAQVTWDLVILVFLLFLAVIYPYEAVFRANDDKTERTKRK